MFFTSETLDLVHAAITFKGATAENFNDRAYYCWPDTRECKHPKVDNITESFFHQLLENELYASELGFKANCHNSTLLISIGHDVLVELQLGTLGNHGLFRIYFGINCDAQKRVNITSMMQSAYLDATQA